MANTKIALLANLINRTLSGYFGFWYTGPSILNASTHLKALDEEHAHLNDVLCLVFC